MFEKTKALCEQFLQMGIPGLDLIVYQDGQCILRHTRGYADLENQIPMQGTERYHIYSCSKLFTCTAAMQLWEKGLFDLEDKLSDYLPAFGEMTVKTETGVRKARNPIRIRHLFEMTSGMNYDLQTPALQAYYEANAHRCPTVETVNQMAKTPLDFEPGEGWQYSLSHDVLAALVEVLSGQKFEQYVKANIFDPLGMTHTDFLHPMEDWEGFARQYHYNAETKIYEPWFKNVFRPGNEYASGGAGCVSTVEDYIRFLEALRVGDIILKKETIARMAEDHLTPEQWKMHNPDIPDLSYGLGLRVPRAGSSRTEFGWGGAAGAFVSVDPVHRLTIYYAQHVVSPPNMFERTLFYDTVMADLSGSDVLPAHPNNGKSY